MLKTCEQLKDELEAKYDVGLTFGYVGNLEPWGDDRRWSFFTLVPDPSATYSWQRQRFIWGDYKTTDLDKMKEKANAELEQWIIEKVMPHQPKRSRPFRVDVPEVHGPLVKRQLMEKYGVDKFGLQGHNRWVFYLSGVTLPEMKKFVTDLCGGSEGVTVLERCW